MNLLWFFASLVVLVNAGSLRDIPKKRYDNFSVYKLNIQNDKQLELINQLSELTEKFNIWKDYDEHSKQIDIMVNPVELKPFQELLKLHQISSEVIVANVQELIDEEQNTGRDSRANFGWTKYYELAEIEAWLDGLLTAYPKVTEGFVVGKSFEGRNIRGIKISHNTGKPGIFIESNIHAREWITSASATWFINELLTSKETRVRTLAENYDWYIVPVFNVDGFEHSHRKDRMWRKTRQPHATNSCIGADANRNFNSYWMQNNGASSNPCSETYAGTSPESEPEAKALVEYLKKITGAIKMYISFHSYGQYLLSPYGHSKTEFPPNYDHLLEIGEDFVQAVKSLPYKTSYRHGSTASVLYVASGSSVDYVFNELGKKVGYTIEFRDTGRYGFILPPVQIIPNCEELMAGMVALVDKTQKLGYL